jgi:hypothetical protein
MALFKGKEQGVTIEGESLAECTKFGQTLVEQGLLTPELLAEALASANGDLLVMAESFAKHHGIGRTEMSLALSAATGVQACACARRGRRCCCGALHRGRSRRRRRCWWRGGWRGSRGCACEAAQQPAQRREARDAIPSGAPDGGRRCCCCRWRCGCCKWVARRGGAGRGCAEAGAARR